MPPRAPAERVALAIRVRREPVYVAGRYLKLQRCDKALVYCYLPRELSVRTWLVGVVHNGFVSPGLS